MTRKLENLLNLPENISKEKKDKANELAKNYNEQRIDQEIETTEVKRSKLAEIDKISASLPPVTGLGSRTDRELDEITKKAISSYEELMDLGMNVEQRYAGRLFEVANNMLKTGLDARIAKVESKLKIIDLQLKKEKLEQIERIEERKEKLKIENKNPTKVLEENKDYVVSDRNSLLEKIKNMNNQSKFSEDSDDEHNDE